jgi:glycosyltransferase involved in cell wall biosynthesis
MCGSGMDLLQVVASTARRGAEVFACDLESALTEKGYRVRTLALAPTSDAAAIPVPTLGHTRLGLGTLRALRSAMAHTDIVVAHGSTTLPACALASVGLRVPFIYRNIGDPSFWNRGTWRRARTRFLLRRASMVVALAPRARESLIALGVDPSRVRVIANGVDSGRFPLVDAPDRARAKQALGLPGTSDVVAYVGALRAEKDLGTAAAAMTHLPGAWLVVAGDGPERATLEEWCARVLPGRTRFVGQVEDPAPVLAAADVLVLPSRTEGLPGVLVEAGLSGIPVVATNVGYVTDVVVNGQTGIVVPPGDSVAVAAALKQALADRARLGRAAREWCMQRFDLGAIAPAWSGVVDDVLSWNQTRA